MEIIKNNYKIIDDYIIYNEENASCPCLHSKETEEYVSKKIEHGYIKNRKNIILSAVDKIKMSKELFKGAVILTTYFVVTSSYNILYVLGNPGIDIATSPLFVSNIVALMGGLFLNGASKVYRKTAENTFKEVDQVDTFINLKDEFNSKEVKNMLQISNPHLFERIKSSKLEQPINLNIYSQMSPKDKIVTFDIASVLKDNREYDPEVQIINMFEVEDETIPEATKIRRMYTK